MKEKITPITSSSMIHMCISIAGALRNTTARKMDGWMTDEQGRPLSGKYVREQFKKAQFEGKRVLPMGDCDNFDYQTGCKGHYYYKVYSDIDWEIGEG